MTRHLFRSHGRELRFPLFTHHLEHTPVVRLILKSLEELCDFFRADFTTSRDQTLFHRNLRVRLNPANQLAVRERDKVHHDAGFPATRGSTNAMHVVFKFAWE
jgi:hypothetical protein